MPTAKTPSKVTSKKLQANKRKNNNRVILLIGILIAVAVGVVVVRYSSASGTPHTFTHYADKITSGTAPTQKSQKQTKVDGKTYWVLNKDAFKDAQVSTQVTVAEAAKTAEICVHYNVVKDYAAFRLQVEATEATSWVKGTAYTVADIVEFKGPHDSCVAVPSAFASKGGKAWVQITSEMVAIDMIYGKSQ